MKMAARVKAVIDIPFDFDVKEPDESGHSSSRIEAAKHAEGEISSQVHENLSELGDIVSISIEQVHEL